MAISWQTSQIVKPQNIEIFGKRRSARSYPDARKAEKPDPSMVRASTRACVDVTIAATSAAAMVRRRVVRTASSPASHLLLSTAVGLPCITFSLAFYCTERWHSEVWKRKGCATADRCGTYDIYICLLTSCLACPLMCLAGISCPQPSTCHLLQTSARWASPSRSPPSVPSPSCAII